MVGERVIVGMRMRLVSKRGGERGEGGNERRINGATGERWMYWRDREKLGREWMWREARSRDEKKKKKKGERATREGRKASDGKTRNRE